MKLSTYPSAALVLSLLIVACDRGPNKPQTIPVTNPNDSDEQVDPGDSDQNPSPVDGAPTEGDDNDEQPEFDDNEPENPELKNHQNVFVHLFEWKWTDIARECHEFLGPRQYSAVQVSPPNEHAVLTAVDNGAVNYPWWQRYQPVSYKLQSRSGTRAEFVQMVEECAKAGVDIYVDAVINHMAAVVAPGYRLSGSAGNTYTHYEYPDFSRQDFNFCGTSNNAINDYQNADEVRNCELLNLADLKTSSEYVRETISDYLAELLRIGVAGFRIDAAKHMPVADIDAIIKLAESKAKQKAFVFQEVIDQGGEPIRARDYLDNGHVTEFQYSLKLSEMFRDGTGKLHYFNNNQPFGEAWGFLKSENAVVFVDNHDNQRGHGGGGAILNFKNQQLYELANIFMLAWPYGYPKVMSSYEFQHPSDGPPADEQGRTRSVHPEEGSLRLSGCQEGWVCEHRLPRIAAMVGFRAATKGAAVEHWFSNEHNRIAFAREAQGFVAINRETDTWQARLQTGLKAGIYCNILQAECEQTVTVDEDGWASLEIAGMQALALQKDRMLR